MEIEYLRTSNKRYMIVKHADYLFGTFELQMILRNQISRLLPLQVILEDGNAEYWYEVGGMQSLEKLVQVSLLGEKQIKSLLYQLMELKDQLEDYLLTEDNICFDLSMIYADRQMEKMSFCYIPGLQQDGGITHLFEELLPFLDHSDEAAVKIAYEVYENCMQNGFVSEQCKEILRAPLMNRDMQTDIADDVEESLEYFAQQIRDESREIREPVKKKLFERKKKKEKRSKHTYRDVLPEGMGVSCVAEDISNRDQTICFSEQDLTPVWILEYEGDGLEKDLSLYTFPFLVGKDEEKADGVLKSRTVSRIHAKISRQGERIFLEDYNSTNGTYKNGTLIPMNTPVELLDGDKVVFATEIFTVRKYMGLSERFWQ